MCLIRLASHIALFVTFVSLAACGGGESGSGGQGSSPPPPPPPPPVPEGYVPVSGSVGPGIDPASLSMLVLGRESPVAADGSFEAIVYDEGVALAAAVGDGNTFGPMTIFATDGSAPVSPVIIDATSTAVTLVFLSPEFIASDPIAARQILTDIAASPSLQPLVDAVENAFSSPDPLADPQLLAAWTVAVAAIANELANRNPAVGAQQRLKANAAAPIPILRLPRLSSATSAQNQVGNTLTYAVDLDYTTITVRERDNEYLINPDSDRALGLVAANAVDWLAEIGEVDATALGGLEQFEARTQDRFGLYPRKPSGNSALGQDVIQAEGYARVVDFASFVFDSLVRGAEYFLDPEGIAVPADTDAIYVVRSFSGGWLVDEQERFFVVNEVPNGEANERKARATNYVSMAVELLSIFIDFQDFLDDGAAKDCLDNAILNVYEQTSLSLPVTGSPTSEFATARDVVLTTFEASFKCVGNATFPALIRGFIGSFWKNVANNPLVDVAILTERIGNIIFTVSPLESAVVVVGTPLLDDTIAPTVPVGIIATPRSDTQIDLNWEPSTDEGSGVAGYRIFRDQQEIASSTSTGYSDTGLLAVTQYCYEIEAYDFDGNPSGKSSPAVCANTLSETDSQRPSPPTGLTVVVVSDARVDISWSASSDNEGVQGYVVLRDDVDIGTTQGLSFSDTSVAASTTYCYSVFAFDATGNDSEPTTRVCVTTNSLEVATEGWLSFQSGDPGIPGDGVIADGEPCSDQNCPYSEFTPTKKILLGPGNTPITLSVFEARFGFFIRFRLAGYPEYCSSSFADGFNNGDTPTYNDVPGRFLVIDEAIFNDGVERARTSFPDCEAAPASEGYISRIDSSTGGLGLDGAYLAYGAEVFPDDGLQPGPDSENWVAFAEGDPGVPDDGILVAGQPPCTGCPPQHTIIDEIVVGDADGLTLNIYGSEGEAIDNVVLRFQGYPEVCNFEIPIGGVLPSAPLISGKPGTYLSLQRSTLATQAQTVAILNAASCGGVTAGDVYYSAFELSGTMDLVDGTYVGVGQNVFPSDQ